MLKVLEQVGGYLQAQARFASATRTGEGQQTHVRTPQERTGGGAYLLPPDERSGLHGQVVGATVEALEGREVGRQVRDDELVQAFGALQVLEAVCAEVPQTHACRQVILDEGTRRLGQEGLPTVSSGADARRPMHVQADIAAGGKGRLAGMQAHAHPHRYTLRPGMAGNGTLRRHGRRHGVRGALEGRKKPVPRRVDLVAIPRLERLTQQSPVLRQHLGIPVAQVLEEACGVLDVAEQEGDGATGGSGIRGVLPCLPLSSPRGVWWSAGRRRLL